MASETPYDELQRLKIKELENRDFNDAIIGDDTGQQKKFLPNQLNSAQIQAKNEKKYRDQAMTALMLMLQDPAYAEKYQETMDLLLKAETASEALLIRFQDQLEDTKTALEHFKDTANRTSEGTMVFKDQDGNVYDEHHKIIQDPVLLDSIVWKDNAPTHEDYIKIRDQISTLETDIHDIRLYQIDVLAPAREKMTDHDNPIQKEEIEKIQDDILDKIHPSIKSEISPEISKTVNHESNIAQEIAVLKI